jgi:hypothetical protein
MKQDTCPYLDRSSGQCRNKKFRPIRKMVFKGSHKPCREGNYKKCTIWQDSVSVDPETLK